MIPTAQPVLQVDALRVRFAARGVETTVVDDVTFSVMPGQIMALVGESGCGKSMTAHAIMDLIDAPATVSGAVLYQGRDLRCLSPGQMRQVRGNHIAMIFQDSALALNPVLRIDTQMVEAIRAHQKVSRAAARAMAHDALERVGIAAPAERLLAYPHQLSGGMRQRVAIAIALLNKPGLIICDEPTTALDVTTQAQILYEMQKLCRESGAALIWITHDLSVVAGLADTVSVMYAGRIVESGSVHALLSAPRHPYTASLIASTISRQAPGTMLREIAGTAPPMSALPSGCAFRPRCAHASPACVAVPQWRGAQGHGVRCFHPLGPAATHD